MRPQPNQKESFLFIAYQNPILGQFSRKHENNS